MRYGTLLLGALALSGCTREPTALELSEEQLMVHSILRTGSETVHVLVERVAPLTMQNPEAPWETVEIRPVSGAVVEVVASGHTTELEEAPADFPPCSSAFPFAVPQPEPIQAGCYAGRIPRDLEAGKTYQLRVSIDGRVVAEGSARVPGVPEISSPAPRDRYEVTLGPYYDPSRVQGILVRYEVPEQIEGVRPSLAIDSVHVDGALDPDVLCSHNSFPSIRRTAPVDSVPLLLESMFCYRPAPDGGGEVVTPESIFARVVLAGFDDRYLDYADAAEQSSAEYRRLRAGLTGALGLFTGVGVAERGVVLVPSAAADSQVQSAISALDDESTPLGSSTATASAGFFSAPG